MNYNIVMNLCILLILTITENKKNSHSCVSAIVALWLR